MHCLSTLPSDSFQALPHNDKTKPIKAVMTISNTCWSNVGNKTHSTTFTLQNRYRISFWHQMHHKAHITCDYDILVVHVATKHLSISTSHLTSEFIDTHTISDAEKPSNITSQSQMDQKCFTLPLPIRTSSIYRALLFTTPLVDNTVQLQCIPSLFPYTWPFTHAALAHITRLL